MRLPMMGSWACMMFFLACNTPRSYVTAQYEGNIARPMGGVNQGRGKPAPTDAHINLLKLITGPPTRFCRRAVGTACLFPHLAGQGWLLRLSVRIFDRRGWAWERARR